MGWDDYRSKYRVLYPFIDVADINSLGVNIFGGMSSAKSAVFLHVWWPVLLWDLAACRTVLRRYQVSIDACAIIV